MGKKKRGLPSATENIVTENESGIVLVKEATESENIVEQIPAFKNPKFVQAKLSAKKSRVWKSLRQITTAERANPKAVTYLTIEVPVSLKPPKKYSDISGLEAKYTDPQTKMRFANAAEFQVVRSLQPEVIASYLSLRLISRRCSTANYFVSTPIFYVNGAPHIGHMQSCLYADALARVHRLMGKNVLFSTGTDEHGLKVQQVAEASKKPPAVYCAEVSKMFEDIFKDCNVDFTHFIRTSDKQHKDNVQEFWKKLQDAGHITKGTYEGWYSVTDEAFVPSSQVKEIKDGKNTIMVSMESGNPVEKMSEENYVFPLSKFQSDILHWLSKDVIQPKIFLDDVKRWVQDGLTNLSVSRPKSRLSWGIPVPNDDSQIIYVWLDALVNYLTVSQMNNLNIAWPIDCHVIGKDILKFHAIYWPAFLIAAGYEPPRRIFCHSHWTVNYEKMSKSKGNVVDPIKLISKYSCDGFRYFLLRASVPHSDTNYTEDKILRMLNAELADTFGNLLSRSCAPAVNPTQTFPKLYYHTMDQLAESNVLQLITNASALPSITQKYFLDGNFHHGIDSIMNCLRDTNNFLQVNKPWELARKTDEISVQKLSTILHIVLEVLRISGLLLQPVIPTLSARLLNKLQIPTSDRSWINMKCFPSYNHSLNPLEGQKLEPDTVPLYERRK